MIGPFGRWLGKRQSTGNAGSAPAPSFLPYSWILTQQLAIGPMPRTTAHWAVLEEAGLRGRFSCCYPEEEVFSPIPENWQSSGFPLPDHRHQEVLQKEKLILALDMAESMIVNGTPLYLHCLAGRERSALMAVGLTARIRSIDIFAALDWVRRCHPYASPLYEHLDVLEQALKG